MSGTFRPDNARTRLQKLAETALRDGLMNYDRRYGWRGPIAKIGIKNNWFARLDRAGNRSVFAVGVLPSCCIRMNCRRTRFYGRVPRYAAVRRNDGRALR